MRILLIRLDKIGDLVSTLPVDAIPALKGHDVRWVVAHGLGFVARNAVPPREALELDRTNGAASSLELGRLLDEWKPDIAVSFQAPWWVSTTLWKKGVAVRAGVRSQWHSFLFLNRSLRQKRSRAEKHEADYNRELLEFALREAGLETPPFQSHFPSPVLELRAPAVSLERFALPSSYVVVHPGMAGSALNWPQKSYVAFIRAVAQARAVVITGTPMDEGFLSEIRRECPESGTLRWLVGQLSADELLAVLAKAATVVAPSTGVAHLAAALGRPVIALFSPLRVQRPERWAPRGPKVSVILPPGADTLRDANAAEAAAAMEKIRVEDVLAQLEKSLA